MLYFHRMFFTSCRTILFRKKKSQKAGFSQTGSHFKSKFVLWVSDIQYNNCTADQMHYQLSNMTTSNNAKFV